MVFVGERHGAKETQIRPSLLPARSCALERSSRRAFSAPQNEGRRGGLLLNLRGARRQSSPGVGGGGLLFVRVDRRRLDQGEADVVEPFDQALLAEGVDLELDDPAVGTADLLRRQIDGQRRVRAALGVVMELGEVFAPRP